MLELKNIIKVYPSGGENIRALRGVSLRFRNNEFVSILGPSGCGKTTMLNIIGGLDQYTEGDLLINGRSTREYKDRDWDNYRNHTIGFVFQSYNLIPHQTVLSNVELALTLSGVSKKERRERAKRALEAVGLGNQLKKRPAQMSGGQMQRVAIARAIVNDPDIILADEPTGALDSETGIQVMNLLQEIARDRLVIMVTHNPELAEQYSTRIIRMLDGAPVADTAPISAEEFVSLQAEDELINQYGSRKEALAAAAAAAAAAATAGLAASAGSPDAAAPTESTAAASQNAKQPDGKRASMSFATAFGLSLNNLFTKKGRTLLTAFAGSIGIIGIALIYAVSQGTSNYIDTIQEDTLSSYPLTITTEAADYTAMISGFVSSTKEAEQDRQENSVIEQPVISSMFSGIGKNDLRSLKAHLDANADTLQKDVVAIRYSYGLTPQIYTIDVNGDLLQANPARISAYMSRGSGMGSYGMSLFSEMAMPGEQTMEQYDLLAGRWPERYDEMLLVLGSPGKISDMLTYSIGLHDPNELTDMLTAVMNGEELEVEEVTAQSWTYEELLAMDFRMIPATARYRYDAAHNVWEDMSGDNEYMDRLYSNAMPLKVTGIVTARSGSNASTLSVGYNYLTDLTRYMMDTSAETDIVRSQLANRDTNVFSGKPFGEEDSDDELDFAEMIHVDGDALASAFHININTGALTNRLSGYLKKLMNNVTADTSGAAADFTKVFQALAKDMLQQYIANNGSNGMATVTLNAAQGIASSYMNSSSAANLLAPLTKLYAIDAATLKETYTPLLSAMLTQYITGAVNTGGTGNTGGSDSTGDSGNTLSVTAHAAGGTLRAPALSPVLFEGETDTPGTDTPGTDTPGTDTPGTDTPGTDTPGTDTPGTDTPGTDEPGTDDPSTPEVPGINVDDIINDLMNSPVPITSGQVDGIVASFSSGSLVSSAASVMGARMLAPQLQAMVKKSLTSYAASMFRGLMSSLKVDEEAIANAFGFDMTEEDMVRLITALNGGGSTASASENLRALGYADPEVPETIYIYLRDFEGKDRFIQYIEDYNDAVDEEQFIRYTDITGVLMSSVTTIINAVTYVLIAFVSISLIVSSIMIGVITLISVQERTKEIGILRAIGASKRNVSGMFNAETMIIGFSSGLIGVLVTYLLCIPINIILHKVTGISYLSAKLPIPVAIILVIISTGLTLISGIIPSRSAAKKDPVVALRTE